MFWVDFDWSWDEGGEIEVEDGVVASHWQIYIGSCVILSKWLEWIGSRLNCIQIAERS